MHIALFYLCLLHYSQKLWLALFVFPICSLVGTQIMQWLLSIYISMYSYMYIFIYYTYSIYFIHVYHQYAGYVSGNRRVYIYMCVCVRLCKYIYICSCMPLSAFMCSCDALNISVADIFLSCFLCSLSLSLSMSGVIELFYI